MKKITFLFIILTAGLFTVKGQETNVYWSFSNEFIFSFADIDNQGYDQGNIMRFTAFNPQTMVNFDFGEHFGLFSGAAVRNVGFIYDNPLDGNRHKYRTYNFGIPVGFKVGKLNDFVFFGGYEIEFPFVYKEKLFVNEVKEDKFTVWFSDRNEPIQHSVVAGLQFPYGPTIKFKYYFSNFHNRDYTAVVDGIETKPYDFQSNIFYISLAFNVFTNWKEYEPKNMRKVEVR